MHSWRPLQALRDLSYILQRSAIITHLAGGQKDKTGSIQDGNLCHGNVLRLSNISFQEARAIVSELSI